MIDIRNTLISTLQNVTGYQYLTCVKDGKSDAQIQKDCEKYVFKDSAILLGDITQDIDRQSHKYNLSQFTCNIWFLYRSTNGLNYLDDNITNVVNQLTYNNLSLTQIINTYFLNSSVRGDITIRTKYHKVQYIVSAYDDIEATKADAIFDTIDFYRQDGTITQVAINSNII